MANLTIAPSIGRTDSYLTKQDLVYQRLKESILIGSLAPEERLLIRDIAAKLGVSETPVRAALARLRSEGLIAYVTHVGATVAELRNQDINDAHIVVAVLQSLAAERAALNATPSQIEDLRAILDAMEKLPDSASFMEYNAINRAFHRTIVEASDYSVMASVTEQLFDVLARAEIVWKTLPSHRQKARSEHRAVLNAIECHRAQDAKALMEKHFLRAGRDFMENVSRVEAEGKGSTSRVG